MSSDLRTKAFDPAGSTTPAAQAPSDTAIVQRIPLGSDPLLRQHFMVTDEPVKANLRVGLMLERLDSLAEMTALRYVQQFRPEARVVTASIDDLKVCAPPDLERDIDLLAQINYVGKTSVEVGIRIEHPGPQAIHLGSCYFTMVARLPEGKGLATLPGLRYVTNVEAQRAERAALRRRNRSATSDHEPPSAEEWKDLLAHHQEASRRPGASLAASDLLLSTWERTYPAQENVPLTIFGGYILHRAYVSAHMCAELVADHRALLVAASRINFYEPVRMGDKLHFLSRVTYVGNSSVCVETEIVRVSRDRSLRELSNTCVFTFVNVDKDLNLLPIIPVSPGSFIEDARYLAGRRRHMSYLAQRSRGAASHPSSEGA